MAKIDEQAAAETHSRPRSRRIMKWGSAALIAFLAFAPPGTMIVIFLLVSRALGVSWIVVGALGLLAIGIVMVVVLHRKRAH